MSRTQRHPTTREDRDRRKARKAKAAREDRWSLDADFQEANAAILAMLAKSNRNRSK